MLPNSSGKSSTWKCDSRSLSASSDATQRVDAAHSDRSGLRFFFSSLVSRWAASASFRFVSEHVRLANAFFKSPWS
eukprot:scaffold32277_cov108-Isochrysis_galbana.AAC.5